MFAALHVGAPFGYADAAGVVAWAAFGNAVGGIGFVTVLRLIQVGRAGLDDGADG
jgi:formate-nitrite transporter family protein